ncbi:GNAT family N-acetyltransferase [Paracoccus litorisediminis]|uniref:GNAT family N-acetyltransferase n=1 Tax=Paracoccus litorisediminis TaxID=2006130 RepID=UPI00373223C8
MTAHLQAKSAAMTDPAPPNPPPHWLELGALCRNERERGVWLAVRMRAGMAFVEVIVVEAARRGQGLGHAAMMELNSWADRHHLPVLLTADPDYARADPDRLINFYSRLGYRKIRGGGKGAMRRDPQPVPEDQPALSGVSLA